MPQRSHHHRILNISKIVLPWICTFILLGIFYVSVQLPMQHDFYTAVQCVQRGDFKHAEELFARIRAVYPNYAPAYFNEWLIYTQQGLSKSADFYYEQGKKAHLINGEDYRERGFLIAMARKYNYSVEQVMFKYNRITHLRHKIPGILNDNE